MEHEVYDLTKEVFYIQKECFDVPWIAFVLLRAGYFMLSDGQVFNYWKDYNAVMGSLYNDIQTFNIELKLLLT